MRLTDSGAGRFKALLAIAFLLIVVFVGFKTIPVYVNSYELDDYIREQTPFWLTQRAHPEAIQKLILAKADELGLPVTADQVKVQAPGMIVIVSLDYTVPVDLVVYTLQLHFAPSAENKQI
jgi:hypothetical protein